MKLSLWKVGALTWVSTSYFSNVCEELVTILGEAWQRMLRPCDIMYYQHVLNLHRGYKEPAIYFPKKKSHTILCVIGLSVCILIVLVSTKSSSTASLCTSFLFNEWNLLLLKNLSLSKEVYSGGSNDFFCVSEMARQQSMHFCGRITCFFGVEVKIFLLWIGLSNSGGESCPSSICWLEPNRRNWRCLEEKLAVTTITFWHFVFTRSFVSNKPGWGPIWPFGNNTLETRNISLRFARPWA